MPMPIRLPVLTAINLARGGHVTVFTAIVAAVMARDIRVERRVLAVATGLLLGWSSGVPLAARISRTKRSKRPRPSCQAIASSRLQSRGSLGP